VMTLSIGAQEQLTGPRKVALPCHLGWWQGGLVSQQLYMCSREVVSARR
jgi:hypothetical protein